MEAAFNFQELYASLKDVEVIKHPEKQSKIIEECSGYYTIPCTKQPFEGDVIQLSGDEVYIMFQKYWSRCEFSFREKLHGYDEWFYSKPHRVQQAYEKYITKWLREARDNG